MSGTPFNYDYLKNAGSAYLDFLNNLGKNAQEEVDDHSTA